MTKKILWKTFFILFLCYNYSYGISKDSLAIVKADNNNFYLSYYENDINKRVFLPYPFTDSAIFVKKILFSNKDEIEKESFIKINNVLIIALADFDFSNKKIIFFIDESNNKILEISKSKELYLETGLPFFIVSENGMVIISNSLSFAESTKEKCLLHYYQIKDEKIKFLKDKKIEMTEKDLSDSTFINKNFIKSILNK